MKSRGNKSVVEWSIRTLAILVPAAAAILRLAVRGSVDLSCMMLCMNPSCLLLSLIPVYRKGLREICTAAAFAPASILVLSLFPDHSNAVFAILYALICCIPPLCASIFGILRESRDENFLKEQYAGAEMVKMRAQMLCALAIAAFTAAGLAATAMDGAGGIIVKSLLMLLMLLFALYLVLRRRSAHGEPVAAPEKVKWKTRPAPEFDKVSGRRLYEAVRTYMDDEKPYLDSNFSLEDICRTIGMNRTYVSKMINSFYGMNVSQFINKYRLDHAISIFTKNPRLKIDELAHFSGFSSRVTFAMAFKLTYGENPSDWCRKERIRLARNRPAK